MGTLIFLIILLVVFMIISPIFTTLFLVILFSIIWLACYLTRKEDEKIVSAEVVDRTQIMREECQTSGFSFGFNGNPRIHMRFVQVPSYIQVKLAVVYENGKHDLIVLNESSGRFNRIMSICEKRKKIPAESVPVIEEAATSSTTEVDYIDVKKNQLVAGVYVIGEAIPEGNYDLKWVWGSGSVHKYVDNTTTLGASNLFQWVGNTKDYEQRVLVNVACKSGEYLHIDGNLIVEIRKSKPVVLDLE